MKKKILLKMLAPLTAVGISLGTVLPLVSCSCGNNENNGDNVNILFQNKQQFNDFLILATNNALVDPNDAEHDWTNNLSDYQPMLDWFYSNIDASSFVLLRHANLVNSDEIIFPFMYTYYMHEQLATVFYEATDSKIYEYSVTKKADGFHISAMGDGLTENQISPTFEKAGISNGMRRLRPKNSGGTFIIQDTVWPKIKFPNTY